MRAVIIAILLLAWAVPAQADLLRVARDEAVVVLLPGAARDVVLGNPAIADVQVQGANRLVVIGKGYGETSLTVLGAGGKILFNKSVAVTGADGGRQVSVITADKSGFKESRYSCAPRCVPVAEAQGHAPPAAPPPAR